MTKIIKLYSDQRLKNLFKQIFPDFQIIQKNFNDLQKKESDADHQVIFLNKLQNTNLNLENLNDSHTIITDSKSIKEKYFNLKIFTAPIKINKLISLINDAIKSRKNKFSNIELVERYIVNTSSSKKISLTDLEMNILSVLIKKKKCERDFIKENVLMIKKNIESNSLDSHLTRIRKKLEKIDASVKIITKHETLSIIST